MGQTRLNERRSSGRGRTGGVVELLLGGRAGPLSLDDPARPADHLGERPVRDALAVGQAPAAVPPDGRQAVHVLVELPRQAGLADPAIPMTETSGPCAVGRAWKRSLRGAAPVAAHERRLEALGLSPAEAGDDPARPPQLEGLGLALELVHARVGVGDGHVGGALGRLADEDPARARRRTGGARRC